ncbi:MAG: hypothetical protein JSW01_05175 [Candidatus Bathyarchaeota archaeon]|nr:MAG: hypothetical protein JSW01_05175 [Candidatus Bathyarchaeota archaeon]
MVGRVRPHRVARSYVRSLEYLVAISWKYGIEPEDILDCLFEAREKGESVRGDFKVECRNRADGYVYFLLTSCGEMVAQLRLKESLLVDQSRTRSIFERVVKSSSPKNRAKETVINPKISDLKVGARVAELKARVVSKQPTKRVQSRWGNSFFFSLAAISDGTAVINLPLWNAQTSLVSIGDMVQIRNGRVGSFRGERQLNIPKKMGKLSVL